MKLIFFFVVIIALIFVNVNCRSPPFIPPPHPVHAFAGVDACDQPKKIGPTTENNNFTRYYYNKDDKECQSFIFEGGPQTENNFETKDACDARCPNIGGGTVVNVQIPTQSYSIITRKYHIGCDQSLVNLKNNNLTSNEVVERFYFNKTDNECQSFMMYVGGATSFNNFETKESCISSCLSDNIVVSNIYSKE